jgi:glycosyltransferase involved in cell wall biosynthesis
MLSKPLLSICIPTFNRFKHLKKILGQLEEFISSTDSKLQICISDNSSTDSTWHYLNSKAIEIPELTIKRQTSNIGSGKNVIDVTSLATGKWILIVGDDDEFIESNLIELLDQVKRLEKYNYVLLNTKLEENKNLLNLPQGERTQFQMQSSFLSSVSEYGFVGSHLMSHEAASVMRKIPFELMRAWPSLFMLLHYSLKERIFVISNPIIWQSPENDALTWHPTDWLKLVIRRTQVILNSCIYSEDSSFHLKIVKKELVSLQFFKDVIFSYINDKDLTREVLRGKKFTELFTHLSTSNYFLVRSVTFLLTGIPKSAYLLMLFLSRGEIKKYIYSNKKQETDGVSRDVGILD